MNTYNIVWPCYGNSISRNEVIADPRPLSVEADYFKLIPGEVIGGVGFYKNGNTEPFLTVFEIPVTITRAGA